MLYQSPFTVNTAAFFVGEMVLIVARDALALGASSMRSPLGAFAARVLSVLILCPLITGLVAAMLLRLLSVLVHTFGEEAIHTIGEEAMEQSLLLSRNGGSARAVATAVGQYSRQGLKASHLVATTLSSPTVAKSTPTWKSSLPSDATGNWDRGSAGDRGGTGRPAGACASGSDRSVGLFASGIGIMRHPSATPRDERRSSRVSFTGLV